MPLISMKRLLSDALQGGYAVCYCEAWNMESFQAVIDAAVEMDAPVIAGFSGSFLLDPGRKRTERLAYYAGLRLALEDAPVPVSFLLNESDDLSQIKEAMDMGFNAVMVENAHMELHPYRELVLKVVDIARAYDVAVEAQVGRLPHGCDATCAPGEITDPIVAKNFVEDTNVDALGVSIGNVHILTTGGSPLDLDVLADIRAEVSVPLVLHGGTGIPEMYAPKVIRYGIAKVNFGTVMKQAFLAAFREKMGGYREPMNPHPFLGLGGDQDVMCAGREAVTEGVKTLLQRFGSAGKAGRFKGAMNGHPREVEHDHK